MLSRGQQKAHQKLTVVLLLCSGCPTAPWWCSERTGRHEGAGGHGGAQKHSDASWDWGAESCSGGRQREAAKWLNKSWWMPVSVLGCCTLRLGHVVFKVKLRKLRALFKMFILMLSILQNTSLLNSKKKLESDLVQIQSEVDDTYRKPETLRTRPKRPSLMWESVAAK